MVYGKSNHTVVISLINLGRSHRKEAQVLPAQAMDHRTKGLEFNLVISMFNIYCGDVEYY